MPGLQQLWSTTANSNQTADPAVNFREGMAPSQVNDSARQIMATLKKYVLDTSGALVTAGTSTAYTLPTFEVITALTDGLTLGFRAHAANTGAATLAVDGLSAKPLRKGISIPLAPNDLLANVVYRAVYSSAGDEFLVCVAPSTNGVVLDAPTGTRMAFQQTAAPSGWTKESGAAFDDAAIRLYTGTPANGGSAAFSAAFASRVPTGSVGFHNLTVDEMPSHGHFLFQTAGATGSPYASDQRSGVGDSDYTIRANTTIPNAYPSGLAGGGAGHNHGWTGDAMDFNVKFVGFIVAQKD